MVHGAARGVTVGTRGSALARTQTDTVVRALQREFPALEVQVRVITTQGDRAQEVPISELGDKAVFVRALETALLSGEIDIAVHSLKDVPSDQDVPGLTLAAFPPREDARDVVVARDGRHLSDLPPGAKLGTSSLRRRAQLLSARPDLQVKDIRGNVDTRLRKLREGEFDAIVLAAAGLLRLGLSEVISEYLPVELCVPDAGQGILAVQTRGSGGVADMASALDDRPSRLSALAERACVRALGADCRSPVGAFATIDGEEMTLLGMAAREDGSRLHRLTVHGRADDPERLGTELGSRLFDARGID